MWCSKLIELWIIVFIHFKSFSVNLAFAIKLLVFKVVSTHFSFYKTLYTLGSDCCGKKKNHVSWNSYYANISIPFHRFFNWVVITSPEGSMYALVPPQILKKKCRRRQNVTIFCRKTVFNDISQLPLPRSLLCRHQCYLCTLVNKQLRWGKMLA